MEMLKGLKTKIAKFPDASMKIPGKSVNSDTIRKSTGEGGDDAGPGPRAK